MTTQCRRAEQRSANWSSAPARTLVSAAAAIVLLSVVGAFSHLCAQQTPACPGITDPVNQAQGLRRCVHQQQLKFAAAEDSRSDSRMIDVIDSTVTPWKRRFNCNALISPEVNSHRNDPEDLGDPMQGGGRILARVEIFNGCRRHLQGSWRDGYGKLGGFPIGVSWIWVDSYEETNTPGWGSARAIVIPQVADLDLVVTDNIRICQHPEYEDEAASARWVHQPQDAAAWWTCMKTGCCNLNP